MCDGWEMLSGKFAVVATLMQKLRQETTDRIVIVSNYTQTLDLFQTLCRTRNVSFSDCGPRLAMKTPCNNGCKVSPVRHAFPCFDFAAS